MTIHSLIDHSCVIHAFSSVMMINSIRRRNTRSIRCVGKRGKPSEPAVQASVYQAALDARLWYVVVQWRCGVQASEAPGDALWQCRQ